MEGVDGAAVEGDLGVFLVQYFPVPEHSAYWTCMFHR